MPPGVGWRGVETVLGSVDGLRKFVETQASPRHGLNFCQGTVAEMLERLGCFGTCKPLRLAQLQGLAG